ncbi:MAG: NepR family anti-sigma factor [Pseudomonadota bacterium]
MDNEDDGDFPLDERIEAMIGQQLRNLYDAVLAEPIPDKIAELLSKLDEIPVPPSNRGNNEGDGAQ